MPAIVVYRRLAASKSLDHACGKKREKVMKYLFWIGTVVLVLGFASLFIPIPHTEREGVKAGGISLGIETRHEEKLPPIVSGLMIVAGAGLMIAAKNRAAR